MSLGNELWGTLSVNDHLLPRAFVAETVAFDRLVITQTLENDEEKMIWMRVGRGVNHLKGMPTIFEDLVISVPWNHQTGTAMATQILRTLGAYSL